MANQGYVKVMSDVSMFAVVVGEAYWRWEERCPQCVFRYHWRCVPYYDAPSIAFSGSSKEGKACCLPRRFLPLFTRLSHVILSYHIVVEMADTLIAASVVLLGCTTEVRSVGMNFHDQKLVLL